MSQVLLPWRRNAPVGDEAGCVIVKEMLSMHVTCHQPRDDAGIATLHQPVCTCSQELHLVITFLPLRGWLNWDLASHISQSPLTSAVVKLGWMNLRAAVKGLKAK